MNHTRPTKGAIAEHIAVAWLLANEYHVFKCVSYNSPIDIVAWKNSSSSLLIDVKTATRNTWKGKISKWHGKVATPEQVAAGIRILYVNPETKECSWSVDDFNLNLDDQQNA